MTSPIPIQSAGIRPLPEEPINPVNEELKQAHAALSPEAKQAISIAGPPQPTAPGAIPLAKTSTAPAMSPATPPGAIPINGAAAAPSPAIPINPRMQAARDTLSHLTVPESPGAKNNLPGVDQIHHAAIRIPLQILDAIGSGIFPNIAMGIPGTSAHHALLTNRAAAAEGEQEGQASADLRRATETAQIPGLEAEGPLKVAETKEHEANAESKIHPQPKVAEGKTIETADGIMQLNPDTGKYDIRVGDAPGKNAVQHVVSSDGSVIAIHTNAKTGETTHEVIYHGDPKVKTEVKQLQVNGKPHQVLVNSDSGDTIKDLGESGEKPPVVNVNAQNNERDREAARFAKPHEKSLADASTQLEKINDARAMINGNAESQALGIPKLLTALVSGSGSGVRITQPELNAIAKARGLAGDVEGTLRGWAGKGKLTPEQQRQATAILDDVAARLEQKRQIANDALDKINAAPSREEIARIDKEARKALTDMEHGRSGASIPTVNSKADFDKLPSGAVYMEDGKKFKKP